MKLKEFLINKSIGDILVRYGRDNDVSPSLIIEHLVESFLYNKGYIEEEIDEPVLTPAEIYAERKNKFMKKGSNGRYYLKYGDLDFGYFRPAEIDEVIEKLLYFSDEELKELDRQNWRYGQREYYAFVREKLDNPLLTLKDFFSSAEINRYDRKYDNRVVTEFTYKGDVIAHFNHNIFSEDIIDNVGEFLNKLSRDEVLNVIEMRKKSELQSSDFILDYMNEKKIEKKKNHLKYTVVNPSGNLLIQKNGVRFGTHKPEKIKEVWDFLNDKNWDNSYSMQGVGLKGKAYVIWLYSEMGKEKMAVE